MNKLGFGFLRLKKLEGGGDGGGFMVKRMLVLHEV